MGRNTKMSMADRPKPRESLTGKCFYVYQYLHKRVICMTHQNSPRLTHSLWSVSENAQHLPTLCVFLPFLVSLSLTTLSPFAVSLLSMVYRRHVLVSHCADFDCAPALHFFSGLNLLLPEFPLSFAW